jgi:hypothetical protein
MKTITVKPDNQSVYAFSDDTYVVLGEGGTVMPDGSTDISVTAETADLWESIELPSGWGPAKFCFDGTTWTTNPLWVDPNAEKRKEQEAARKAAYEAEADPLFFMSQRGEATVEEWQAKVQEIKARYPYPEETQA